MSSQTITTRTVVRGHLARAERELAHALETLRPVDQASATRLATSAASLLADAQAANERT